MVKFDILYDVDITMTGTDKNGNPMTLTGEATKAQLDYSHGDEVSHSGFMTFFSNKTVLSADLIENSLRVTPTPEKVTWTIWRTARVHVDTLTPESIWGAANDAGISAETEFYVEVPDEPDDKGLFLVFKWEC